MAMYLQEHVGNWSNCVYSFSIVLPVKLRAISYTQEERNNIAKSLITELFAIYKLGNQAPVLKREYSLCREGEPYNNSVYA